MPPYLQGHHESVLRAHRWRTAANSAAYLLPHLGPGMQVLDVGCGPGSITNDLADAVGPAGHVLGVDSSAEVVELARAGSPAPNVRFAVQDALHLDLPDGAFDIVHAHQVLQHLADPVAALREMMRVTRPGGLVAVRDADYAAMTWHPASAGLDSWRATYRSVARSHGAEPDAGRRLLSWARAAGFAQVVPSASVWCFATPADRAWWGGLQADRIVDSDVARHAVAASLTDDAGLRQLAESWRAWAETDDGWFAVVHGEVLCRLAADDQ
ncbi:MAG: methyltransferase domain-containing protein [Mycobacteriales bacterium]